MTYSSSHVWSKIRWCMNLTPDQKIQTDETFFIISYSYHPTWALFFLQYVSKNSDIFSFSLTISPCWIHPRFHWRSTWNCLWPRVQATTTQWRPRCSSGLPAVPSKDESWKNTWFNHSLSFVTCLPVSFLVNTVPNVAHEGFKHWLSHSMPGMRKRNSPCWRTHPRHQCLQCVDAKICSPPKIHHVPTSDKFVTYRVRSSLCPLFCVMYQWTCYW